MNGDSHLNTVRASAAPGSDGFGAGVGAGGGASAARTWEATAQAAAQPRLERRKVFRSIGVFMVAGDGLTAGLIL
jgi:hypothetical protein